MRRRLLEGAPSVAPSGYTGSKLREKVVHESYTCGFFGGHSSVREIVPTCSVIGASKTIPSTLGLWALVVDAAPHVRAMSEGLLATVIQEKDTELGGCI